MMKMVMMVIKNASIIIIIISDDSLPSWSRYLRDMWGHQRGSLRSRWRRLHRRRGGNRQTWSLIIAIVIIKHHKASYHANHFMLWGNATYHRMISIMVKFVQIKSIKQRTEHTVCKPSGDYFLYWLTSEGFLGPGRCSWCTGWSLHRPACSHPHFWWRTESERRV